MKSKKLKTVLYSSMLSINVVWLCVLLAMGSCGERTQQPWAGAGAWNIPGPIGGLGGAGFCSPQNNFQFPAPRTYCGAFGGLTYYDQLCQPMFCINGFAGNTCSGLRLFDSMRGQWVQCI